MRDIRIGPVNTAWRQDPDGRRLLQHGPDLYRRGMGSKDDIVLDIKRVLHISCRMVLGNIECFEIIIILFDFRTFHNGKTERCEYGTDFFPHLCNRVKPPGFDPPAFQGHVHSFPGEGVPLLDGLDPLQGRFDFPGQNVFDFVALPAEKGSFIGRYVGNIPEKTGQQTLPPEVARFDFLKFLLCPGPGDLSFCSFLEFFQFRNHANYSPFAIVAIFEKALGSCTARSARIFLSRTRPDFLTPAMKRL